MNYYNPYGQPMPTYNQYAQPPKTEVVLVNGHEKQIDKAAKVKTMQRMYTDE